MPIPLSRILEVRTTKTPFSAEELEGMDLQSLIMMITYDLAFTVALLTERPALLNQCVQSRGDLEVLLDLIKVLHENQSNCLNGLGQAFTDCLRTKESEFGLDQEYVAGVVADDEIEGLITVQLHPFEEGCQDLVYLIDHLERFFSGVDDFLAFVHAKKVFTGLIFHANTIQAFVKADATFDAERLLGYIDSYQAEVFYLITMIPEVLADLFEAADPSIFKGMNEGQVKWVDQLAWHQPVERGEALLAKMPAASKADPAV